MKKSIMSIAIVACFVSCQNTKQSENNNQSNESSKEISTMTTKESGLQYIIFEQGEGVKPTAGQQVSVHYKGMLEDGTVFDNSYDRGEPIVFPVGTGRVIKGWDEGIMLLNVGTKAQLIIPSELGYGERGAGAVIPPNATLIFDVELVAVQ